MFQRIIEAPKNKSFFLFGPRQTGKSTWVRDSFAQENMLTYDLLSWSEQQRLLSNPDLFRHEINTRNAKITHVFVDEVQKIPQLLDEVHLILTTTKKPPHFILSGSSARKLKQSGANMLAGRAWRREMFPLMSVELEKDFDLIHYLENGGLPSAYLTESKKDAREFFDSYISTYIKEEVELEAKIRNLPAFHRFLNLVAEEDGGQVNFTDIGQKIGVSHTTVRSYYQILIDTLLGYYLEPMASSERRRLTKHPKFYLFDCGVRRGLTQRFQLSLFDSPADMGVQFENFVIGQTRALNSYMQKDFKLSYYRTESGVEIDLIIETPKKEVLAIEIKSSTDPSITKIDHTMNSLKEILKIDHRICVARVPRRRTEKSGLHIFPVQDYLEFLKNL